MIIFSVLWFTFAYLSISHMVWYWDGPDAYTSAKAADIANSHAGFIFQKGALDFAGGTVVHIDAAMAGIVGAFMVGKRVGYGRDPITPHNLTFVLTGVGLLLFGWYGFNAGSSLEANGLTALIILNSTIAAAAAALAWTGGEWIFRGHPSLLGGASGAVAGLVAITPACGFVGPGGAILIGIAAGFICLWAVVGLKAKLGYDDALDVFGVHCIGGIIGALGTGILVNPALGGVGITDYTNITGNNAGTYDFATQMIAQGKAVGATLLWSGIGSAILYKLVDVIVGLRPSVEAEREGLDLTDHGERAYNM